MRMMRDGAVRVPVGFCPRAYGVREQKKGGTRTASLPFSHQNRGVEINGVVDRVRTGDLLGHNQTR